MEELKSSTGNAAVASVQGRFAAGTQSGGGESRPVLWEDGVPRLLAGTGRPAAVTSSGLAAGDVFLDELRQVPVVWRDGAEERLPLLPGADTGFVNTVTEDGRVAGVSQWSGKDHSAPTVWTCT